MIERVETQRILRRMLELLRGDAAAAVLVTLLLSVPAALFEWVDRERIGILPLAIVSVIAQCEVTRRLLLGLGHRAVRRRYGPMFALALATTIPMMIGFVLLILPGFYLAARWSVCDAVLLAENTGVAEAMGISWERTRSNVPPIVALLILIYVPSFVVSIVLERLIDPFGFSLAPLLTNLCSYAGVVVGWYAAVAIHQELRPPTIELERIFA